MSRKVRVPRYTPAGTPSPNTGKFVLFGAAALVILLIGFTIGKATSSSKSETVVREKSSAIGDITTQYGPTGIEGVVPVGFADSTQGAVTAATSYVAMMPKLYFLQEGSYNTSVTQFVVEDFRADFRERVSSNRSAARDVYAKDSDAFFREFPLGYVIESETSDSVTVSIWSAVMLASRPDFDGRTMSQIHTIELIQDDGDWKVSNWNTVAGPTPRWQSPTGLDDR
jgi:hypothetical protein